MAMYTSSSGKTYLLGKELGAGGEGIVYEIQGDGSNVAKIYKSDKFKSDVERLTMDRKLKAMINMSIPVYVDGKLRLAWPLDILYQNGSMVGFIMPKINAKCKIFDIQRVDITKPNDPVMKIYPNYTWKYSVQFAYNLSWVVNYVHSKNIVIGDLNQNNIYVDTVTGAVILIDCDSFDIRDPKTGEHFPCVVGLPEMLAPELQSVVHLSNGAFTKETDNFSLAIHIFRLLMKNADPFGAKITSNRSVSNIPANAAIVNGECLYVRNVPGKAIPDWSPTLDMLPANIQNLVRKTFEYDASTALRRKGNRATAFEWMNALAVLGAADPNPNLKKCSNPRHVYPAHSSYCPWCRCDNYKQQPISNPTPNRTITNVVPKTTIPVSTTQGSSSYRQAAASNTNNKPRRTPYLFYGIMIAFGLASGFAFGGYVCQAIYSAFDTYIEASTCTGLLSVIGVIGGALLAHHFEDQYIHADNAIPWLCMGIGALLVPLVVVLALGIVAGIVMAIVAIIVAILELVFAIACACAICSGS